MQCGTQLILIWFRTRRVISPTIINYCSPECFLLLGMQTMSIDVVPSVDRCQRVDSTTEARWCHLAYSATYRHILSVCQFVNRETSRIHSTLGNVPSSRQRLAPESYNVMTELFALSLSLSLSLTLSPSSNWKMIWKVVSEWFRGHRLLSFLAEAKERIDPVWYWFGL